MRHLLATIGCVAGVFVAGGLAHLFWHGLWAGVGVAFVFAALILMAAGIARLVWLGLNRLGVLPHGPGPFRVENGVTRVYVNRWKALAFVVVPPMFGLLFLVLAVTSGSAPWEVWAGILFCAGVPAVFLWRYGPRRLLDRDAALLIDARGIRDPVKGIDVGWDEVARLVPWEQVLAGGATQRWLGIEPREDAVLERQSRSVQLAARLDDFAHAAAPPMNVQLNLLGTTTDELVAQIRRYWDGPIDGYPLERTSAPDFGVRQSPVHRFLVWAGGWAVAIAIGGGIVALAIWLGLA